MKTHTKNLFLLPVLMAGLALMLAGRVTAQTFTTLYNFTATSGSYPPHINTDGANPRGGLLLSGKTLYGTAASGGNSGSGTVFAVNTDGTGFTSLYTFTARDYNTGANSDGANPVAGLILSGNTLYGTACLGGSPHCGTVFAVNTDGTGFTTLHAFTGGSEGANPAAGLLLSGNILYGTTSGGGGSSPGGTVFAVNTDGTGFTILYSFTGGSDGRSPQTQLILSGNTLYGTAMDGGDSDSGTVFAVNTDGTGFTTLHSFTGGSDGARPYGALVFSSNTLCGTTQQGGSSGDGTVFKIKTDGTGFTTLHSFTGIDGAGPVNGLILSGSTLYGTATSGGSSGRGTVFAVNTDGTGFTTV